MKRTILLAVFLSAFLAIPAVAALAAPGWIVSCSYSHGNNDDPIVFPGQPGAAHAHEYAGARTTNAFSTPDSMRAGGTSCAVPGDRAGYWLPALYKNGVLLHPLGSGTKNALFYYREVVSNPTAVPIPDGLKMIIGDARAASEAGNTSIQRGDIVFKCGPGSTTNLMRPPTQCGSGLMVVSLRFPNCWNGTTLDSADHKSHMSYPVGGKCPSTHPVNLPRVESFFRYNVGTAPIGDITFSSGPYYTVHMDFMNAWVPADLAALVQRCMGQNINCGTNPTP